MDLPGGRGSPVPRSYGAGPQSSGPPRPGVMVPNGQPPGPQQYVPNPHISPQHFSGQQFPPRTPHVPYNGVPMQSSPVPFQHMPNQPRPQFNAPPTSHSPAQAFTSAPPSSMHPAMNSSQQQQTSAPLLQSNMDAPSKFTHVSKPGQIVPPHQPIQPIPPNTGSPHHMNGYDPRKAAPSVPTSSKHPTPILAQPPSIAAVPPTSSPLPPVSSPFLTTSSPLPPSGPLRLPTSAQTLPPSTINPPTSTPYPPTSAPYLPNSGPYPPNPGPFPPMSGPFPPTSGPFPPTSGPFPPTSGPFPPTSGPFPPNSGPFPPNSGPFPPTSGSFPPTSGPFPPTSGPFPPTSGPFPPTSGSFPPTSTAYAAPLSASSMPPPVSQPTVQAPSWPPTHQQGVISSDELTSKAPPPPSAFHPPTDSAQQRASPYGNYTQAPAASQQQQQQQFRPSLVPPRQEHTASQTGRHYPKQPSSRQQAGMEGLVPQMSGLSVTQQGFSKLWGQDCYDLMQMRNILPPDKVLPPKVQLHQTFMDSINCSPEIFRCTLTKIPESNNLLQKSRLPLGILIHPFKDLSQLPVIQCNTIVRCRSCRTYINPFVYFVDNRRWKCNLCFRVNELPEEFQYDPVSKTYGDPSRRPEVKTSTIEFIAPSEYMLRPPQPAVYVFILEVSRRAVESGYLNIVCSVLLEEMERLPGDGRTKVAFLTFDTALHFYNLSESLSQPHMMVVGDVDDVFLPCPDNLLVNLHESRELVKVLLEQLPKKFLNSNETGAALGAALQATFKLMAATGGRATVFQVSLPTNGPGSLQPRETPGQRSSGKDALHLNPATDFYKRLALDCSGQQVAVDLFLMNSQYADLATLSGISRFSGGCIYHFPGFNVNNSLQAESLEHSLRRYLTRKIGFEAVMRVRCTRGLAIHTFHGNFFVRSTDLLSLPNVNPDVGFGMQVAIEESLSDVQNICFQAALLYTSSKGERRIRVHTLCLPIAANLNDVLNSADQQCIVGLLSKMAVDRSQLASLSDAREAFINVAVDVLSVYRTTQTVNSPTSGLLAPHSMRLLPLYIVALLKNTAFRASQTTKVDDRLYAMCQMKCLPLAELMQCIYPDLYPVHYLSDEGALDVEGRLVPQPPRLHLSAEKLDSRGIFLLDTGENLMLYVGRNVAPELCQAVLGVPNFAAIPDSMYDLPVLQSPESERLRSFITYLQSGKSFPACFHVLREDSQQRGNFLQHLLEDRSESALSYYEFLQHLKAQVK